MNMTDVATWGQLISSAAVLVTLVYLSIQTRQTTTLLRSESRQAMIEMDMQSLSTISDWPIVLLDFFAEGEITMENKARLWAHLTALLRTREHHWFQYRNGVLDRDTWAAYQSAIPLVLGTERNRAWWNSMGRYLFAPAFVETVDALIEGQEPNTQWQEQMLAWK